MTVYYIPVQLALLRCWFDRRRSRISARNTSSLAAFCTRSAETTPVNSMWQSTSSSSTADQWL